MFNKDKTLQRLKKLFATSPVRVIPATILSIEGATCTVRPLQSDLTLFDVGLIAESASGPSVAIVPKLGSLVLVGTVGEKIDLANLCICQVLEGDTVRLPVGEFTVELGESGAAVRSAAGRVELSPAVLASLFLPPANA